MRRVVLAVLTIIALVGGAAVARAQETTRQLTGTVVEEGSNSPIPSAQIQVRGTTAGALSRADGSFTVLIPQGEVVLVVRRLGYRR